LFPNFALDLFECFTLYRHQKRVKSISEGKSFKGCCGIATTVEAI